MQNNSTKSKVEDLVRTYPDLSDRPEAAFMMATDKSFRSKIQGEIERIDIIAKYLPHGKVRRWAFDCAWETTRDNLSQLRETMGVDRDEMKGNPKRLAFNQIWSFIKARIFDYIDEDEDFQRVLEYD